MSLVAIALFGEDVSPRFDCCGALAFVDSEQGFAAAEVIGFPGPDGERRIGLMLGRQVEVLLCGGIRRCDWFRLHAQGVTVISGLLGPAQDCFSAYLAGSLSGEAFEQPRFGCQRRQRGRKKGG